MIVTDHSNVIPDDVGLLLDRITLLDGAACLVNEGAVLVEYGSDKTENLRNDVAFAGVIHLLLLFEGHAYAVSSGSNEFQVLGVQDGFVYFYGAKSAQESAEKMMRLFESNPLSSPAWSSAPKE